MARGLRESVCGMAAERNGAKGDSDEYNPLRMSSNCLGSLRAVGVV